MKDGKYSIDLNADVNDAVDQDDDGEGNWLSEGGHNILKLARGGVRGRGMGRVETDEGIDIPDWQQVRLLGCSKQGDAEGGVNE